MAIRILLVDDQASFRDGLRAALSVASEVQVVGEAGDGEEALRCARSLRPDVILMDLRMPHLDGVEATRRVCRELPSCRVIALTTFEDDDLVFGALRAGATGYLLKGVDTSTLLRAISGGEGGAALSPPVAGKVLQEFRRLSAIAPPELAEHNDLSGREIEVVKLLALGASNKEIGSALGVAEGTVKNHVTRVLEKLNVSDRTQAALRARDLGIVR